MSLQSLDFGRLYKFDAGGVGIALNEELQRCVDDMRNRPHDDRPRTITLVCKMIPVAEQRTGDLEQTDVQFELKSNVPMRKSAKRSCVVQKNGQILFNDLSPNNPRQGTLAGLDGPEDEEEDESDDDGGEE